MAATAGSDLKLLGLWPSPFVLRARVALNMKSVKYEYVEETLNPKSELLLKSNPAHKKVPVLIHADKPVSESLIIVQYIDEVWPSVPPLLPSDPYDRSLARFWAVYVDDKLFPSLTGTLKAQGEGEEAKKAAIEQVAEVLQWLENAFVECSGGDGHGGGSCRSFFGGDQIGYVDIALGSFVGWLRVTEKMNDVNLLDDSKIPNLCRWADNFCADAAIKDIMPEADNLLEFAKTIMHRFSAPPPPN